MLKYRVKKEFWKPIIGRIHRKGENMVNEISKNVINNEKNEILYNHALLITRMVAVSL